MHFRVWLSLALTLICISGFTQRACIADDYRELLQHKDAGFQSRAERIEETIRRFREQVASQRTGLAEVITIPVVVHVLYHYPFQNISDGAIHAQLAAMNRDFRKRNADTTKIPGSFAGLSADCAIEFKLAISDPQRRSTSGIIRKYTPVKGWTNDDQIKSSAAMGDDAWDPSSYLNIWIGALAHYEGYSSFPGAEQVVDGIVLNTSHVGNGLSRTGVHEAGHWLGLYHLWGTQDCGDDFVSDTPKQRGYTSGCPNGIRISCGADPRGDMYMNFMDYTSDACALMFTEGQKQRMQALFAPGGPRHSLLQSKGLQPPLIQGIDLPSQAPRWLEVKLYPNPAEQELTLNWEYDTRWVGQTVFIYNANGQVAATHRVNAALQKIDLSRLQPGLYFIKAEKADEKILQRFIKQ